MPLRKAVKENRYEVAQFLVESGMGPDPEKDADLLVAALENQSMPMLKLLLPFFDLLFQRRFLLIEHQRNDASRILFFQKLGDRVDGQTEIAQIAYDLHALHIHAAHLLERLIHGLLGKAHLVRLCQKMLEVGTGFNSELTGRENIYLNGAILGMTKAEVNKKIDKIIEFSEIEQFIDTPAKRYSSGMYVKLAFAVAAHLDSEIMIMDEVLAVGDIAFQRKCLDKMGDVSREEGRTILYVSHNMETIRRLCDRCIVMDKGRIIFDGDVEEAIAVYTEENKK